MKYFLDLNGELSNISAYGYLWVVSQIPEDERNDRIRLINEPKGCVVIVKVYIK